MDETNADMVEESGPEDMPRLISEFEGFIRKLYYKKLLDAASAKQSLNIDFKEMDEFKPELSDILLNKPDIFFEIAQKAITQIDIPEPVKVRVSNLQELISIRDLRSRHIGKFICVEGTVRKASEIRPEILQAVWECPECNKELVMERRGNFIPFPVFCDCGNRKGFKQSAKTLVDTRWVVIEEPFELTEGERPSQVTIMLSEDLVSPDGRRITDPGNRMKINGILKDIPKGKMSNVKLDFFLEANFTQPVDSGWEKLEVNKEDEEEIKRLAADPAIYKMLVDSLAPSIYGMEEIKEAVILQLFGGVRRNLKDKSRFRGDIHILLLGDPSSGKSQLLKLVPQIVPRGKYVSGKGATTAGLTATVSKDEQFMGGWVLEAGAMVMANKGLLAIDEFEKMTTEDQVAMHEALEQGTVSIAKASIVTTLPAQTSVLAGGNPKFGRFDTYMPIAKQITVPDTLLTRFDLKFILKDIANEERDKKVTDHLLLVRDETSDADKPRFEAPFLKKYIAYAKEHYKPRLTKEAGQALRSFYVEQRKKAEGGSAPIPITLRQFEALIRLAEASAKIQLSDIVRPEDVDRSIKLMKHSLRQLGMDPDTGLIDIDRSDGSTPASERSQIRIVLDIINELSVNKKEIQTGEIIDKAQKQGVKEAEEVLEKLKREGMLFEPSPGYVQKI